ncbi:hypothetical protein GOC59_32095, partial [Sinorhizobium medicae]|nr:hypothetical protein [Sinorhizobium medicae]
MHCRPIRSRRSLTLLKRSLPMWTVDLSKVVTAEQKAAEARAMLQAQYSAA